MLCNISILRKRSQTFTHLQIPRELVVFDYPDQIYSLVLTIPLSIYNLYSLKHKTAIHAIHSRTDLFALLQLYAVIFRQECVTFFKKAITYSRP